MKKVLSFILAVCTVMCVFVFTPVTAQAAWTYGGSGTSASPYIIDSTTEFNEFMNQITSGTTYKGNFFRVDANLIYNADYKFDFDTASGLVKVTKGSTVQFCLGTGVAGTTRNRGYVTAQTWEEPSAAGKLYTASSLTASLTEYGQTSPLTLWGYVNSTNSFAGTLDFNGHSIEGIYINTQNKGVGLFNNLGSGSVVKNLTLKNSFICGGNNVGGIVGNLNIVTGAHLINCVNEATVCATANVAGGIVGITSYTAFSGKPLDTVKIIGCENKGAVSAHYFNTEESIQNGKIYNHATAGGIVGHLRGGELISCVNSGIVYATGIQAGAMAGLLDTGGQGNTYDGSVNIYGCVNTGKIVSVYSDVLYKKENDKTYAYFQTDIPAGTIHTPKGERAGGLIGYLDQWWSKDGVAVNIEHCLNSGEVLSGGRTEGGYGFVGYVNRGINYADRSIQIRFCNNILIASEDIPLLAPTPSSANNIIYDQNNLTFDSDLIDYNLKLSDFAFETNKFLSEKYSNTKLYSELWFNSETLVPVGQGKSIYDEFIPIENKGTEEDPVVIDSLQDLIDLRTLVNSGNPFDGVVFVITQDIDLSSVTWTPIGNRTVLYQDINKNYFGGTLIGRKADGSPVTISGLSMNTTSTSGLPTGFIGVNKGVIANINFKGATLNGKKYVGTVAAENFGTIQNCNVLSDSVITVKTSKTEMAIDSSDAPVGGICAANFGNIVNCKNYATVTSDYCFVGGIAGHNAGKISYCNNYGEINGVNTVGGIVGYNTCLDAIKALGVVSFCGNEGNVTVSGSHAAGVVGWSRSGGGISYCYNAATITNTLEQSGATMANVAGVLGCGNANRYYSDDANGCVIESCYNVGKIYANTTEKTTDDVAAWVVPETVKYLAATPGREDENGIYDGAYVKIVGTEKEKTFNELIERTSANFAKVRILKAEFDKDRIHVHFSEPVVFNDTLPYIAIRFCSVDSNGVPNYMSSTSGTVMQHPLTIIAREGSRYSFQLNSDNSNNQIDGTAISLAQALAGTKWGTDANKYIPLLAIEGLSVSDITQNKELIENVSSRDVTLTYKNNYGLYTSTYTATTITVEQYKNGEFLDMYKNSVDEYADFSQEIGIDAYPTIRNDGKVIELVSEDGQYRTPADYGYLGEGSLVGFRDYNNVVHKPDTLISEKFVSPVFESFLSVIHGASVRIGNNGETGLRWTAKINEGFAEKGYEIVEKGFIIVPTAYITGTYAIINGQKRQAKFMADDFTISALDAKNLDYIKVSVDGFIDEDESTYCASIVNLKQENYLLDYSARAYLVLRKNGEDVTVYSGFEDKDENEHYGSYGDTYVLNSRSPAYIAEKALADVSEVRSEKYCFPVYVEDDDFLKKNPEAYPNNVYYSPYYILSRQTMYSFILEEPADPNPADKAIFTNYCGKEDEYVQMRAELEEWIRGQLTEGDGAIFSATLDNVYQLGGNNKLLSSDATFETLSGRWTASGITETTVDGNKVLTKTYTDSTSGLEFTTTVVLYGDVPTADIKTKVKNISENRSQVLQNFYAIDANFALTDAGGDIVLDTLKGTDAHFTDFSYVERNLTTEFVEPTWSFEFLNSHVLGLAGENNTVFYPSRQSGNSPAGGLSSAYEGFPYFGLTGNNKGIRMAIGWSGQWEGSFKKDTSGNAVIRARQQFLSTFLEKGEEIEAPRIVLTYYEGEKEYGQNIWRETVIKHYTPDADGNAETKNDFITPITMNFWGGITATEVQNCVQNVVKAGIKPDYVWYDAGWSGKVLKSGSGKSYGWTDVAALEANETPWQAYNGSTADWSGLLGNWTPHPAIFPDNTPEDGGSFTSMSDFLHNNEIKLMVHYMIFDAKQQNSGPYTTVSGAEISNVNELYPFEKSDYLHTFFVNNVSEDRVAMCLNIADETVLQKLITYYKACFDEGLDAVRLDGNMNNRLHYWRYNDVLYQNANTNVDISNITDPKAYRDGYTENRWTVNEYRLWDTLKEYNPDFFLDNTQAGGRRIDIEMQSRGMCLWRTDFHTSTYDYYWVGHQHMTQNLTTWVPFTTIGSHSATMDEYSFRSYYNSTLAIAGLSGHNEQTAKELVDKTNEIIDLRPYWYGNFYQLLTPTVDYTSWQSYELYREDLGEGIVVGICREETTQTEGAIGGNLSKTVKLKGLHANGSYLVHDIDDETGKTDYYASGYELMTKGITFTSKNAQITTYKITLAR